MAGVENRFRDCSSIALPAATRALLQSHTYTCAWKTSTGKMDSILSFSHWPKTSAGKMDSILSFQKWEQLSQTIPQFLGLPAILSHFAASCLCPSPALFEPRGMGRRMFHLPLPWIPSGSTGCGALRGGRKY